MKSERLYRALGDVGEDLIERAGRPARKQSQTWTKWAALAACCVLVLGIAALTMPQWGAKSEAPAESAPATAADMARLTEDSPAEMAEAESHVDAPAAAAPAESPAPEPETPAEEAPTGWAEETDERFLGYSYMAVLFDGRIYEPAENNDPAHTASESDGDLRGSRLGHAEASPTEALADAEVYAYGDFGPEEYILVKDERRYDPWVLYRAAAAREAGPTVGITVPASGQSAVLREDDAAVILGILAQGQWVGERSLCEPDCTLVMPEGNIRYHSACGTFDDPQNNRSLPTDEETRQTINDILKQYVWLGF